MRRIPFLTPEEIRSLQVAEELSDKTQKKTAQQIEAIYSSGQNILVSASAGSGKTFVMVERVIDKLLRGVGIKSLFISTFTVKAAGELRERLEMAIQKALSRPIDNTLRQHLSQQLQDLPLADIGTMDAFTQKLVSQHGYLLGVSTQFRLLTDQSEQEYLQEDVFQDLFRDYMSGEDGRLFKQLVRQFSAGRKDSRGFQNSVKAIHTFYQTTANPRQWLQEVFLKASEKEQRLEDLPDDFYEPLLESMWHTANALEDLTHLPDYKQQTAKGTPTKVYQRHQAIIQQLREWASEFSQSYGKEGLVQLAQDISELLPSGADVTVAGQKYSVFKDLQARLSDVRHLDTILTYEPQARPLLRLLQAFMLDFQRQYFERKKADGLFEFADISHLAIALLERFDEVRDYYQHHYQEIMVDEYQDTNHMQEAMLDLLSNGHNRFMVGDIKQSIYRFRHADPQLFNQKFKTYQEDPSQGKLILLKENFRSQIEVLTATNAIFTRLMDEAIGDIRYDDKHQLVAGSDQQRLPSPNHMTEYLLYDTGATDDEVSEAISKGEVELVAKEIIRLHQEEGVAFKDITLLVASRSRNEAILTIFDKHGIPLVSDGGEQTYLQSLEVMVMLETLRAINNPLQDYSLLALLKSPMFRFDEDDLTRIALQGKKMAFYQKLSLAAKGQGEQMDMITADVKVKITLFFRYFKQWRYLAQSQSLYDLIWQIYQDRLYYDYVGAMSNGQKRQANLYALALRADGFEKTGFKGLSRFVAMIDRMLRSKNDLADVELPTPKDAVSLMTIHKSKGLQFKYVFILNMDKRFDQRDERAPFILNRENGIGVKYLADMKESFKDKTPLEHVWVSMPTLAYQIHQRELKRAQLSEQMRLLYVAMTRAEKKLYLVGKGNKDVLLDKYANDSEAGRLPVKSREQMTSFQEWFFGILTAFSKTDLGIKVSYVTDADLTADQIGSLKPVLPFDVDDLSDNRQSPDIDRALAVMASVDELNQRYAAAIELPTVRTPSQVKAYYEPVFDGDGLDVIEKVDTMPSFSLPEFTANPKATSAAIGSALHELMQRLPMETEMTMACLEATLADVKAEDVVKRAVDLSKVLAFFATDLGQLIQKNVHHLHREAPFAMLHPDDASGEEFVIRGIIDGYLLLDDRIVLFDYKTDRYQQSSDILNRYASQMALYAQALRQSYGIDRVESYLILLGGQSVEVVSYDC